MYHRGIRWFVFSVDFETFAITVLRIVDCTPPEGAAFI